MKKIVITLSCMLLGTCALYAQDNKQTTAQPSNAATPALNPDAGKFKFDEESHDFGTVTEGPLAEYDFAFTNVGKEPITITEAHGSCGCTVPSWPHEPIMPGKSAKIHVAYTTQGRLGTISKDVIITSNAQQNPMRLHISGTVQAKTADQPAQPKS